MSFDLIVIGAGAIGSAAAYHAARRGQRVLLLEQFELDHQRGSSHGASRIIRYAYDHPHYIRMSKAVYPMWEALEQESGDSLFIKRVGGIDIGKPDGADIANRVTALTAEGIAFEMLSPAETQHRFPQFRLDEDQVALYQADTGALRASRCVLAHVHLAQKHGAMLIDNSPVESIRAIGAGVEVVAGGETFSAARLILAPGSWINDLLGQVGLSLPLEVVQCQEQYFDAQPAADYEVGRMPAYIAYVQDNLDFRMMSYGIPSIDGMGVKVAWHSGPKLAHADDNPMQPDMETIERAQRFSARHLPAAAVPIKYARPCLYTVTPDEHFVIDTHPQYPQIVISSSCSGHAFKFSTLIGDILADLAIEGETRHDIAMFRLDRFSAR
jgi:sarcosine oxidase